MRSRSIIEEAIYSYKRVILKRAALIAAVALAVVVSSCREYNPAGDRDWPMYGRDSLRSNFSPYQPHITKMAESWIFQSAQHPQPAWFGPAIWDGYAKSDVLPSMRNFDLVFQPTVVGNMLFFGSSGDDAIHALDITTGEEIWSFPTEGPIRIAPTYHKGKLYFGSDDGFAYSIDAEDGRFNWKFAPSSSSNKVLVDGKMISYYPIRTGVTIKDGTAYFAASLLPWKNSYLCAVDIETGAPTSADSYIKIFKECTFEGSMVATDKLLIQPQGRVAPTIFDRETGEQVDRLNGANGAFVLVSTDGQAISNTGSRGLSMVEQKIDQDEIIEEKDSKMVSFGGGKSLIVAQDTAFVVTEKVIAAHSRTDKSLIWSRKNYFSIALIKTGKYLIAGGIDKVEAFDSTTGELVWSTQIDGKAHGLIYAQDRLFVSTDEGKIYCFQEGDIELTPQEDTRSYSNRITKSAVLMHQKTSATSDENRHDGKYRLKVTPRATFTSKDKATVQWETEKRSVSSLILKGDGKTVVYSSNESISKHKVELQNLRKNRYYSYHIETITPDSIYFTEEYDLDNFFNYNTQDIDASQLIEIDSRTSKKVENLIARGAPTSGVALIWGIDETQMLLKLGSISKLKIIAIDKDQDKIDRVREKLIDMGVYGERISLYHVNEDFVPFPSGIFNLIISETDDKEATPEEIIRLLRPNGGVAIIDNRDIIADWKSGKYKNLKEVNNVKFYFDQQGWFSITKLPNRDAGQWEHLYGRADNSAFGGEKFWGVADASDFEVAWMGRPGPRYQADRSGRKMGPLSVDGKLLLEGLNRIIAMDAHNGKILWSCELPGFMRFNMPRDCGNWCADQNYLYVTIIDKCYKIDHNTGEMVEYLTVEKPKDQSWKLDWEYIAQHGDYIYGSSTREGASYDLFSGGWGWYDGKSGNQTYQVCSDNLFAYNKDGSDLAWEYEEGVILNVSITISGNRVWFVENSSRAIKKLNSRRLGQRELWDNLNLVCLDASTGEKIYSKPIDIEAGVPVFFMSQSNHKLAMLSSNGGLFHLQGYNSDTGEKLWSQEVPWVKDNHGGHMSRPAIVNDKLYVRPGVVDLNSGELISKDFPFGSCGTYACTEKAIFYRSGNVSMWNTDNKSHTSWTRLRPDCWVSTIPAQGMLLSPEGGGGCSCGNWFETSIGFAPIPQGILAFSAPQAVGGTFTDSAAISAIKREGVDGVVKYTLDGSKPTANSPRYSSPITIDDRTVVTFGLFDNSNVLLTTAQKEYKREFPAPILEVDTTSTAGAVLLDITEPVEGGVTYYTVDGTIPNPSSNIYREPFEVKENDLVKVITAWKVNSGETRTSLMTKKRVTK